ncbi:MAG TPA: DUF1697 domain-containing protein [Acidimicrobiales bacterium]
MTTRVAFLRAVNLGRRRVPGARAVELVEGLGYADVWSYATSGNVVFDAGGRREDLEEAIGAALERDVGFEVTTFVRSAAELRRLLAAAPFDVGPGDTYFVTFLKDVATAPTARALEALSNEFDTLSVAGRDVHWLMHGRSTDTSVTKKAWESVVGVNRSTSRNTTLLRRLVDRLPA